MEAKCHIFQEIDEDLRQDKAARLWKAYGKYIVALAIFIILAIASYRFIEHKNEKNREQTSELFELASEAGRTGDKKAAIELLAMRGSMKLQDMQLYQS